MRARRSLPGKAGTSDSRRVYQYSHRSKADIQLSADSDICKVLVSASWVAAPRCASNGKSRPSPYVQRPTTVERRRCGLCGLLHLPLSLAQKLFAIAATNFRQCSEIHRTSRSAVSSFWPMTRPLFQALRFGVTAGRWTLGIVCPPILPPSPDISTALIPESYWRFDWPLSGCVFFRKRRGCIGPV